MRQSFPFPVNLSLAGKRCLIFGLGGVGRRKLKSLVQADPAKVLVIDLHPLEELGLDDFISGSPRLSFRQGCWKEEDLEGMFLVFACSSDREQNQSLCALCQAKNILCDNAADPSSGNFISPARVEVPPLALALSSGGASPLLAVRLKAELRAWLKPRALLAALMESLRPHVLASNLSQAGRREIFLSILDSPISSWLDQGDFERCGQWLLDKLPFLTKNDLKEIFKDLECSKLTR